MKYSGIYVTLGGLFIAILLISNTIATKIIALGPLTVAGAIFIFPISYVFGDILTEVYGYRSSRRIIWTGFAALILMSIFYKIGEILPSAAFWPHQEAYKTILGLAPRIAIASIIAYPIGEFCNSYLLSKMKVRMSGKHLWMRTIGSTLVGEGVDTIVFVLIAFWGVLPSNTLPGIILSGYLLKVAIEIALTPVTYKIITWLKKKEGVDTYDHGISYNPFSAK